MLVEVGGLRDLRMADSLMADGLVDAEDRKGSGMSTGILEGGSIAARTLPMALNMFVFVNSVEFIPFCELIMS